MKSRFSSFLCSGLFSVVSILSFPQITLAQLRLGIGIQPGLEGYFLEYQQQGLPLDELRGISACSVGLGASCNKTGAMLQQIVRKHLGLDYRQLLMKAAGGQENYQKFTQFYRYPSAVSATPYSSFWRDGNKYILDSYEYSGIGKVDDLDASTINEVTSKFKHSSIFWKNEVVTPRQGLVELKTAYGLTLVEEALKVPKIEQKIAEASLNEDEAGYHQQNFNDAVSALSNNYSENKKNAVFRLLSSPYTVIKAPLNRPHLNISEEIAAVEGISLEGKEAIKEPIISLIEQGDEVFVFSYFDEIIENAGSTPLYALAGIGGISLMLLLLEDNVGSIDDSVIVASQFLLEEPSLVTDTIANSPDEEATISKIPEPSAIKTLFLFLGIIFWLKRKKLLWD